MKSLQPYILIRKSIFVFGAGVLQVLYLLKNVKFHFFLAVFLLSVTINAQINTAVTLSRKHQQQLSQIKSPENKAKKLKLFFKRDSTTQVRKARREAAKQIRRLGKKLAKNINLNDETSQQAVEGIETVPMVREILSDSSARRTDALSRGLETIDNQAKKSLGKLDEYQQVDEIRNEVEQYTGDITQLPQTVSELKDTEKLGESFERELSEQANLGEITQQQKELEQIKELPDKYAKQMQNLKDPEKHRVD